MAALLLVFFILLALGVDYVHERMKHPRTVKQQIFHHNPSFIPTPTMADGGKPVEEKKIEIK